MREASQKDSGALKSTAWGTPLYSQQGFASVLFWKVWLILRLLVLRNRKTEVSFLAVHGGSWGWGWSRRMVQPPTGSSHSVESPEPGSMPATFPEYPVAFKEKLLFTP